jgi:S-adenosylmethionine synthetase
MKTEDLTVEKINNDPVEESETELVERKGKGHPDTICDSIAQSVSEALCREYRERFGEVLHHNTDEVQLVAGESDPEFGTQKELEKEIYLLLAGRATKSFEGEKIPVDEIAEEAAREFIAENFKVLEPKHLEVESRIGETSTDLEDVYDREQKLSNDTSFGVGHHPLSDAEELGLELEEEILGMPEAGEDIKIMIRRTGEDVDVTVAAAAIARRLQNLKEYRDFTSKVQEKAREKAERYFQETEIYVNMADSGDSVYLTETGTSAENGDDGSVGRGNRYNGLITPGRSMSLEAWSGKNPITHVGKINQVKAHRLSEEIHQETGEFATCRLTNRIGEPVEKPEVNIETTADPEKVRKIVQNTEPESLSQGQ